MTSIEPAVPRRAPTGGGRFFGAVALARRWALRVALLAAFAAAFLVYAIVRDGFPDGGNAVLATLGIAAVVTPPLVLAAFYVVLGELVHLPERLRRLPLEARDHGEQLRALFDQARLARGSRFRIVRTFWQLTRTTSAARETLTPYAPLLPLVSVPFLAVTAASVLAAAIEIVVACVVALTLLA
ncbi:MAG: hypothetical protein ACJ74C_11690 [Gaiellaceae bacterium]